jgi:hypothetical protein
MTEHVHRSSDQEFRDIVITGEFLNICMMRKFLNIGMTRGFMNIGTLGELLNIRIPDMATIKMFMKMGAICTRSF